MKRILPLFVFYFLVSCVPQADKKANCRTNETFNNETRSCVANLASGGVTAPPGAPVGTTTSIAINEDTSTSITLSYTDSDNEQAVSCSITGLPTATFAVTTPCSCTSGVCSFTLIPLANVNGIDSLTYTITDNDGTSLPVTASINVIAVDDNPVSSNFGVSGFEDTPLTVYINPLTEYTDVDGDFAINGATGCTLSNPSGTFAVTSSCSCAAGVCSFTVLPTTNTSGVFTIDYIIKTNPLAPLSSGTGTITMTISAVDDAPVATTTTPATITTLEDTETASITIGYTDVESHLATACDVGSMPPLNLTISTACTCAAGVCTVKFTPLANLNSVASNFNFTYRVFANALWSNYKTINVTVTAVDDAPVTIDYMPWATSIAEDDTTGLSMVIPYTDVENDTATAITIPPAGGGIAGGTISSSTCTLGSCTVNFLPSSNFVGLAYFHYTITANGNTSTMRVIQLNVTEVNDTPTISTIANTSTNEGTPVNVTGISVDEGGGNDETTQNLTLTVSSSNTSLIPNSNVDINFTEAGDASDDPVSLTIYPVAGQVGTATITLTVTDNGTTNSVNDFKSTYTTFVVTVNAISALHGGWSNLAAIGAMIDRQGNVIEPSRVVLEWEDFTMSGATISGYNVYRSPTSSGQNFETPINPTPIPSSSSSYTDSDPGLAFGNTYYYVVRPIDGTYSIPTATTEAYTEIEVPMPPNNMSLLHRWIVNKEVCSKIGQTVSIPPDLTPSVLTDGKGQFDCAYAGPGKDASDRYDLGGHFYIDRFEAGCNYSPAPKCTVNGCIGIGDPDTNLSECGGAPCYSNVVSGDIFYDRSSQTCYIYDGTDWDAVTPATYLFNTRAYNRAYLPPLVNMTQGEAQTYCEQSRSGVVSYRLPTRKEFIAASAWSDSLTDTQIATREEGLTLNTTSGCNSSLANGLNYTNTQVPPSAYIDTLPSTSTAARYLLRTGSNATLDCTSRYGVQDLIGNVREWNLELVQCEPGVAPANGRCSFDVNINNSVGPSADYAFDGTTTGPCVDLNLDGTCDGTGSFGDWVLSSTTNYHMSTHFYVPYGLPAVTSSYTAASGYTSLLISASSGTGLISTAALHGDAIFMGVSNVFIDTNEAGVTSGGSNQDGAYAGRYTMELLDSTPVSGSDYYYTGFRCITPAY